MQQALADAEGETVTFLRNDLGAITEALDEAILHGVATWAAAGTKDDNVMGFVLKAGQARLLIRDEFERAESALPGGAS